MRRCEDAMAPEDPRLEYQEVPIHRGLREGDRLERCLRVAVVSFQEDRVVVTGNSSVRRRVGKQSVGRAQPIERHPRRLGNLL